ncbi:hypothetical protein ACQZ42_32205 [Rhizobium rhizogenes]
MSKGDKQRTGHLDGCGDAERKTRERLIDQDVHQAEGDTKADNREWQGSLRSLPPGPADRHEQKSRKPEAQGVTPSGPTVAKRLFPNAAPSAEQVSAPTMAGDA